MECHHTIHDCKLRTGMNHNGTQAVRIALADDDAAVRFTFTQLLMALGHQVVCSAADGAELVASCSTQEVDVVFVDLDMPVMDGLEAAELLTAQGVPVVLISGHPDASYVVLEHEPFVARIRKPITIDAIHSAIQKAVRC
jgi:CheY-like chemotaxis protein